MYVMTRAGLRTNTEIAAPKSAAAPS